MVIKKSESVCWSFSTVASSNLLGCFKPNKPKPNNCNKYPVSFFFLAPGNINGTSNGSTIRVYEGHLVECIVEINLESHNLVKNIPRESTNGGPSTQRTILNVNSTAIQEYHFPLLTVFIYLFILMYFFHNERTSKACGGVRTHPSHPPSLRACCIHLLD